MRYGKCVVSGLSLMLLTACGDVSTDKLKDVDTGALLAPERVAQVLPPEARSVVESYTRDLRTAAGAYHVEFGRWPTSFAELTSVAGARETAVNLVADGLAEQVPFASRATVEQAANGFVTAAERRIFSQISGENASNP